MKHLALAIMMTTFFSAAANAGTYEYDQLAPDYTRINGLTAGGSGCPNGTVSAELTHDRTKISVFFDEYIAYSDDRSSGRVRKSCNIGISVHVPQGFSFSIVDVDYRGAVYVPYRGKAQFSVSYFFAGERMGLSHRKTWRGRSRNNAIDEDFLLSDSLPITSLVWSECGVDAIMRVNTSARVYRGKYEETELAIDTVDANVSLVAGIQWKTCGINIDDEDDDFEDDDFEDDDFDDDDF